MLRPSDAKKIFMANANKYFKPADRMDINHQFGTTVSPQQQASEYFDVNATTILKQIDDKLTPFKTKSGYTGTGGEDMPEKSPFIEFTGNQPLSPNSLIVTNLINDISENPQLVTIGSGSDKLIEAGGIKESGVHRQTFQNLADKIKLGDVKDLNLTTKWAVEPKQTTMSVFSGIKDLSPAAVVEIKVPENEYKKINGLGKDDTVTEKDRTYVVRVEPNMDNGQFIPSIAKFVQQTQLSPQDIYMQKIGSNINLNFGQKGSASLERIAGNGNESKLKVTKRIPFVTDKGEQIEVQDVVYLDNQNLDEAYLYIASGLNDVYKTSQKNSANYARSTKKQ